MTSEEWVITRIDHSRFIAKKMCLGSEPSIEAVLWSCGMLDKERELIKVGSVYKCESWYDSVNSAFMSFECDEGKFSAVLMETREHVDIKPFSYVKFIVNTEELNDDAQD